MVPKSGLMQLVSAARCLSPGFCNWCRRGVVLESFGVGNMPDRPEFKWLGWLRDQRKKGLQARGLGTRALGRVQGRAIMWPAQMGCKHVREGGRRKGRTITWPAPMHVPPALIRCLDPPVCVMCSCAGCKTCQEQRLPRLLLHQSLCL